MMRPSPYMLFPTKYRLSYMLSLCTLKVCLCTLNVLFTPWTRHDPSDCSSCSPDIKILYKDTCTTAHSWVPLGMRKADQGIDTNYYTSVWTYYVNWLVVVEMQRIRLISELLYLDEPSGAVVFSYTASRFLNE